MQNKKLFISPKNLKKQYPVGIQEKKFIYQSRKIISNIIHNKDSRLLIICGPCSIHDLNSTIDYATRLYELSIKFINHLYIVMRVYYEKPRTSLSWKGYIYDPNLNGLYNIELGLRNVRNLFLKLIKIQQPIAIEILNPLFSYYFNDLISWSSIGARTVSSQIHREIASNLSNPVGFKNSLDGNINNAFNAMLSAASTHKFLGINQNGKICTITSSGNIDSHIILRGGNFPNYFQQNIYDCKKKMNILDIPAAIMIDCNHSNSDKNDKNQIHVAESILRYLSDNHQLIIGLMLESNIYSGNQQWMIPRKKIKYGVSITDPCIGWDDTCYFLTNLYNFLKIKNK
ncbi:MAG: 3-deoxy-7-phosphoheptulonate synthase [Wigglesworthia glossinidia]|nr:3-deoxy-7-phosphoheptulonate synthase [Wigglesworthia glossinidia]